MSITQKGFIEDNVILNLIKAQGINRNEMPY